MIEQVIKEHSNSGFEKSPETMRIGDSGFVLKQGSQDTCSKLADISVDALIHLSIEAELIAEVLADQAFVVARSRRYSLETRSIEAESQPLFPISGFT